MYQLNILFIKDRRGRLNLTQIQAAARAGMGGGPSVWSQMEHGRLMNPTLKVLNGICKALQCEITHILFKDEIQDES